MNLRITQETISINLKAMKIHQTTKDLDLKILTIKLILARKTSLRNFSTLKIETWLRTKNPVQTIECLTVNIVGKSSK